MLTVELPTLPPSSSVDVVRGGEASRTTPRRTSRSRRMASLHKHPRTGVFYYRRAVPAALRPKLGWELKRSLGTKDEREAKRRYPETAAWAEGLLAGAEAPTRLTHKETEALAGEWYRREVSKHEDDPGDPAQWEHELDRLQGAHDRCLTAEYRDWEYEARHDGTVAPEPDQRFRSHDYRDLIRDDVDGLLRSEALVVDQRSRDALSDKLFWMRVQLAKTVRQMAFGDYRPDPSLAEMPDWERPTAEKPALQPAVDKMTFDQLLAAWEAERKRPDRTKLEFRRKVRRLVQHLGHDDPERVTKKDMIAWKDALVASGVAAKTVLNHITTIATLFNSAIDNERLNRTDNPAKGVKVAVREEASTKRLPYSEEDAAVILRAAERETGWKRWLPWLLAFTGARLDEICQALARDVRQDTATETWYLDINADGPGKHLKNAGSARKVPLHHALLDHGFLDFHASLDPDGPLLPGLNPDAFGSRGGTATKRMGRWVRSLGVSDRRKAPAHSWRHRFKDVCREAGIEQAVHDALTGHADANVGARYGSGYSIKRLAAEIDKLPAVIEVSGEGRLEPGRFDAEQRSA